MSKQEWVCIFLKVQCQAQKSYSPFQIVLSPPLNNNSLRPYFFYTELFIHTGTLDI